MTEEGPPMQTTAAADRQGVMIALVPSQTASKALLQHSGGTEPLEGQHITVAYLGTLGEEVPDDPEVRSRIETIVRTHAGRYAALNGEANGWGVFHNDEDVVVALWNIPGVNGLRQALVEDCRLAGVPVKANSSYTPHQTMGYYEPAEQVAAPKRLPFPVRSDFRYLLLTWGGEQMFVPLTGLVHEARDYTRRGNPKNPGQFSKQDLGYDKDTVPNKGKSKGDKATSAPQSGQQAAPGSQDGQAAQEGQEGQEGQEAAEQQVEVDIPPGDDYTGTSYAAIVERSQVLTDEDKRIVGDLYLAPLPAGKYPEGDPRNEPECERVMAEKEALVSQYEEGPMPGMKDPDEDGLWVMPEHQETIAAWRESGTGGQTRDLHDRLFSAADGKFQAYTSERTRHHQEILKGYYDRYEGYPKNGRAIVMAGPPGAGKSTFLDNFGQEQFGVEVSTKAERKAGANPAKNFVTINPDDFKEFLDIDPARYPGLNESDLAAIKHEESSYLAKTATRYFMSQGYDVIIDITLGSAKSAIKKFVTPFEDKYTYDVALVDGDMKNSRNNAGIRFKAPDKETGKRTYTGRFIPMGVIEKNAPTKPGYRSKNAQEYHEFIKLPKVAKAVAYDPYAKTLIGPDDIIRAARRSQARFGLGSVRSIMEAEAGQGSAAREEVIRVAELRKVGSTSHETTEITVEIEKFHRAEITEEALVDYLVNHQYAPNTKCPFPVGTPDWYQWFEDDPGYDPGSYDEVILARDIGLLPWDTFHKVNDALVQTSAAYQHKHASAQPKDAGEPEQQEG